MDSLQRPIVTRQTIAANFLAATLPLALALPASAGELAFRRHVVNPDLEYSAVAVLDVNNAGKQDKLCHTKHNETICARMAR